MDLSHQGCPIVDGDDPVVHVLIDDVAAEADLDTARVQRRAAQAPLRVPLHVDDRLREPGAPFVAAAEDTPVRVRGDGVSQRFFPAGTGDPYGEDPLLAWLPRPVAAGH